MSGHGKKHSTLVLIFILMIVIYLAYGMFRYGTGPEMYTWGFPVVKNLVGGWISPS